MRPSLEQLRKQAKDLLRERRGGNASSGFKLADAQFAIARQYGFESWAQLKRHVEALQPSRIYRIDAARRTMVVRDPLNDSDWDAVFGAMADKQITTLVAPEISDAGMKRLAARLPHVEQLDVSNFTGHLSDAGLMALRELRQLRRFEICWQQSVSDAGVAHLASCELLERVNLLGTPTGDGVIRALGGKPHLRFFKSGRNVTDAGLPFLHDFPAFAAWQGGEIEYSLMSADAAPTHLLLDGPFTNNGLAAVAALDGLFGLSFFQHCSGITSAGLTSLRALSHLGFLGCDGERCDDAAMRHISQIPGLRMLMAQGTVATDAGFAALSRSDTIEYVWGRECPHLTSRGFAALSNMPALRGLAVSCKHVDDDTLALLPRFPSLRALMPMDVPDAGFRHIGGCDQLDALWCMYCRDTGDAATESIAGLSRLKTYYAGQTRITDRSLEMLARMPSLERLQFWRCAGITDAGIAHLARLPNLRELTIDDVPGVTARAASLLAAHVRVDYSG